MEWNMDPPCLAGEEVNHRRPSFHPGPVVGSRVSHDPRIGLTAMGLKAGPERFLRVREGRFTIASSPTTPTDPDQNSQEKEPRKPFLPGSISRLILHLRPL